MRSLYSAQDDSFGLPEEILPVNRRTGASLGYKGAFAGTPEVVSTKVD